MNQVGHRIRIAQVSWKRASAESQNEIRRAFVRAKKTPKLRDTGIHGEISQLIGLSVAKQWGPEHVPMRFSNTELAHVRFRVNALVDILDELSEELLTMAGNGLPKLGRRRLVKRLRIE